jgi:hypothetical protein
MNTPDPSSPPPSTPSAAPPSKARLILAIGGGILVVVVAAIAVLRPPRTPDGPSEVSTSTSTPTVTDRSWKVKQPLEVGPIAPTGVWFDVAKPQALKSVLTENAWLKATVDEPLGRGFLGGWSGFLGSAGAEVGLQKLTQGVIGDLVTDAVLVQPMRLAWFSGWGGSTPALIIPQPTEALTTTFAAVRGAVERGGWYVDGCPGEPPPPPTPQPPAPTEGQDARVVAEVVPSNRLEISRLVVADQPVFAALARERLVFSKDAQSVVHALCGANPTVTQAPGADVVVGLTPAQVGRDVQVFAGLVGLKGAPTVAFKVEGSALRPIGLAGELASAGRLDTVAIPDATWALVPEDLPVAAAVNLKLPKALSTASLEAFYGGTSADLATRQVLLLWQPHGDAKAKTEVALVWSDVADKEALQQLLSGPNRMEVKVVCERLVASSTPTLLSRIEAACTGKAPSLLFAQPAVVAGLKAPASVGAVVDLGRFFAGLLDEGFASDPATTHKKGEVPVEIEAAKKRLRELPRFGVFGDVQGQNLAPRGFSS